MTRDITFLTWRDSTHPDGGGSEVFVEQVARRLVARGHRVRIRCAAVAGQPARESLDGVELVRRGGRLSVYVRSWAWLLGPGRRTDVVVDVINGLPFGSVLARRRGVVALVHHVHREQWHIIYPDWRGRVGWFLESRVTPWLYRRQPHLTVSEASRSDLANLGIPVGSIALARNGVDVVDVAAPVSTTPRLVVLSRLVPHKQIEHVFAAAAALRDTVGDLQVDVVGEGWWHSELVAHARDLGVDDLVTFHGHVPARRRDELLARAWVHVLPSVKEGWGLAVMEAAVQATPTVAYRSAGGVREAVADGLTGVLVEDLDELVATLGSLLGDPVRCVALGVAARERSRQFDWERTTDAVERTLLDAARD